MVMAMYIATCLSRGQISREKFSIVLNNFYFLSLTTVIVIIGGRVHRTSGYREFTPAQ